MIDVCSGARGFVNLLIVTECLFPSAGTTAAGASLTTLAALLHGPGRSKGMKELFSAMVLANSIGKPAGPDHTANGRRETIRTFVFRDNSRILLDNQLSSATFLSHPRTVADCGRLALHHWPLPDIVPSQTNGRCCRSQQLQTKVKLRWALYSPPTSTNVAVAPLVPSTHRYRRLLKGRIRAHRPLPPLADSAASLRVVSHPASLCNSRALPLCSITPQLPYFIPLTTCLRVLELPKGSPPSPIRP